MIQRRTSGNVDFYRTWDEYARGFGHYNTDFWIGLENIHYLCPEKSCQLRVDMKYLGEPEDDWSVAKNITGHYFAVYDQFGVLDSTNKYKLFIEDYHGTAGDRMHFNSGEFFSTYDRDNDKSDINCAVKEQSGWGYGSVRTFVNLNGVWGSHSITGLRWSSLTGYNSVTFSEIKVRLI